MFAAGNRWLLALAGITLPVITSGCAPEQAKAVPLESAPPEVEYWTVRSTAAPTSVELPGIVAPLRSATLSAPVAGTILRLAEDGERLASGAAAAELDAPGLPQTVSAAQAAVEVTERKRASLRLAVREEESRTEARIRNLEKTLESARAERDRRQALLAEAQVHARSEPERLRAQLEAAEARIRLLQSGEREGRIRQLQAEADTASAEYRVAQAQHQRNRDLLGRGYISIREMELSQLGVVRARAAYTQALEELKLQREGAHPEAILEAQKQAEVIREQLRATRALEEQVIQRKAELAQAVAEVARVAAELDRAHTDHLAVLRARQESGASAAEVRRARAELSEAKARLARTQVKSPFSGQVVRRLARPGETVQVGMPLLEIIDPEALQFEASVPEAYLSRLTRGIRLPITIPAASGRPLDGRVTELIEASVAARREYRVKIELPVHAGLRPGMAGTARLTLPASPAGIRLPLESLRRHFPKAGRGEVLVLAGDRVEVRAVTLGGEESDMVRVTGGLHAGDRVVLQYSRTLQPDTRVRARERTHE